MGDGVGPPTPDSPARETSGRTGRADGLSYTLEGGVTNRERKVLADRARAKRRRKAGKGNDTSEPEGVIGQVTGAAAVAARAVGDAVKEAADAATGG